MWDWIKNININVTRMPEGEGREERAAKYSNKQWPKISQICWKLWDAA